MLSRSLGALALVMAFTFPAYILPLILGPLILNRYREDELNRLVVYFTFKPLLATPLWFLIVTSLDGAFMTAPVLNGFLSLLPAIALTLFILWLCRDSLRANKKIVALLLVGDALRWLNSLGHVFNNQGISGGLDGFYAMGLILPNAFAVMAYIIMYSRSRRREAHAPVFVSPPQ